MRWYSKNLTWNIRTSEKELFLTFDDGPDKEITEWVLDLLHNHQIKATFFCLGANVEKNPETYNRIFSDGHHVGNHTFGHEMGWRTPLQPYLNSVEKCASLVKSTLFRPPYGKITWQQIKALKGHYKIVMWSLLSMDYRSDMKSSEILSYLLKNIQPGDILVFHDVKKAEKNLKEVLPAFISEAKKMGFSFSKLSENIRVTSGF